MCQQVALENRQYNDVPTGGVVALTLDNRLTLDNKYYNDGHWITYITICAYWWRWITDITMMCQQVALDYRHYNDVPTGGAG
jgi:hypothetical protein